MNLALSTVLIVFSFFKRTDSIVTAVNPNLEAYLGSTVVLYCNVTGENAGLISWIKYNKTTPYICSFGTVLGVCPSNLMTNFTFSNSVLITTTLTINGVGKGDFTTFACSGSNVAYFNLTQLFATTTYTEFTKSTTRTMSPIMLPTTTTTCKDYNTTICQEYFVAGYCTKYSSPMASYCPVTCNTCSILHKITTKITTSTPVTNILFNYALKWKINKFFFIFLTTLVLLLA